MPDWYEVCVFCGKPIDFSAAAIVLPDDEGPAIYEPFMEDWRGGYVRVAHPRCFAEAEGLDQLLTAVAGSDAKRRSG